MLRKKAGEIIKTWVCGVSFYTLNHFELQSFNRKTTITNNNFRHCCVRFSSFVRQPFSKKLYKAGGRCMALDVFNPVSSRLDLYEVLRFADLLTLSTIARIFASIFIGSF